MRGIDHLIAMRKGGKRPNHVWINFHIPFLRPWGPEDLIGLQLEYRPTDDLRPFVGLDVLIHADRYSEAVVRLFDGLTQYAKTIKVFIDEFEDDLGWQWDKTNGRHDFGN